MIHLPLNTKKCMAELLLKSTFDPFSFIEGEITTFAKFTIDGHLHKEFFEEKPEQEYSLWKDLREYCFSIIRGKRTPLGFKLIFSLSPEQTSALLSDHAPGYQLSDIQGLYLNFRYDGTQLTCTTGTSLYTFTMDKTVEQAWDKWVQKFFDEIGAE